MELRWPHSNQHTEFPGGTSKTLFPKIFNLQLQKNIYTRKLPRKIIFIMQQKQESLLCKQLANKLSQTVILKLI